MSQDIGEMAFRSDMASDATRRDNYLCAYTTFHRSSLLSWYFESTARWARDTRSSRSTSECQPRRVQSGDTHSSNFATTRFWLWKWLMITMRPSGLVTRFISEITRTGSGTTLITKAATT